MQSIKMLKQDKKKQTIFILDHDWNGHHATYFKIFTKILIELGYHVIAICPCPEELKEWTHLNCPSQIDALQIFPFQQFKSDFSISLNKPGLRRLHQPVSALTSWFQAASNIERISSEVGISPNLVFFPWLDSYLGYYLIPQVIDLIFPYKWTGLYFQPRHLRRKKKMPFLPSHPFPPHGLLRSKNCQSVNILDEGVVKKLQAVIKDKPFFVFPDFTDETLPDRGFPMLERIQDQAKGKKIIGLFGSLEKRKGLLKFLEIIQTAIKEDWFFVCVGKLDTKSFTSQDLNAIDKIVSLNPENSFICFERIPDESKFNALVDICDILFTIYDYPHSSNILTKAAVFEKLVISSNEFCMAERVEKFQLGVTVQKDDTAKSIEGLICLILRQDLNGNQLQPNFEGYRKAHSNARIYEYFETILKSLDESF